VTCLEVLRPELTCPGRCHIWYHCGCVGLHPEDIRLDPSEIYICPACEGSRYYPNTVLACRLNLIDVFSSYFAVMTVCDLGYHLFSACSHPRKSWSTRICLDNRNARDRTATTCARTNILWNGSLAGFLGPTAAMMIGIRWCRNTPGS
jgi:hypothetical protein